MNACVHTYTKPQTSSTRRRGPGWRIHGSVEDTKLSTNKQHTLSLSAACHADTGSFPCLRPLPLLPPSPQVSCPSSALPLPLSLMGLPPLADLPPSQVALGTVMSTHATGASPGVMRWSRVDSDIPRLMVSRTLGAAGEARCRALEMLGAHEARVGWAALRGFVSCLSGAGPQTTAEHAVVALSPHSSDQRSCFFGSSRDGASNEARANPRAPERVGAGARETQRRRLPSQSPGSALAIGPPCSTG